MPYGTQPNFRALFLQDDACYSSYIVLELVTNALYNLASKKFPNIQLCMCYTTCDVMIWKHPRSNVLKANFNNNCKDFKVYCTLAASHFEKIKSRKRVCRCLWLKILSSGMIFMPITWNQKPNSLKLVKFYPWMFNVYIPLY